MYDISNDKDLTDVTNKELIEYLKTAKKPVLICGELKSHTIKDTIEEIKDGK